MRLALSSLDESCIAQTMPESYAALKINADDIISQIQNLPAVQEGREWALELGAGEGKHVRYSETVSALWTILKAITVLHRGGEIPFRYVGILRLPDGPSYSRTFDGQQIFPFGRIELITEALEIERLNQQSIDELGVTHEEHGLRGF